MKVIGRLLVSALCFCLAIGVATAVLAYAPEIRWGVGPDGAMTMGIVLVASFAAWTAGVKIATITSTFDRTSSTAKAFASSLRPPAARHSTELSQHSRVALSLMRPLIAGQGGGRHEQSGVTRGRRTRCRM
jgi:hypothetical protein